MSKKIITDTVIKSVKDLMISYKLRGIGEVTAESLEESLHRIGFNFGRSTIGRIIGNIGIESERKYKDGKETRIYSLENWVGYCIHHWMLETPNGPWTDAHCKKCGEYEKFSNSGLTNSYWHTHKKRKLTGTTFKKDGAKFNAAI